MVADGLKSEHFRIGWSRHDGFERTNTPNCWMDDLIRLIVALTLFPTDRVVVLLRVCGFRFMPKRS